MFLNIFLRIIEVYKMINGMNIKIRNTMLVFVCVALASCGTSKKMEQTTGELNRLKEVSKHQAETLAKNELQMVKLEAEIDQLKKENIQYGEEAKDCRIARQAIQTKFDAIHKTLAEKGTSLQQMQEKIENSVVKFRNAGIEVEFKEGLLRLHMPNDLVFNSGSTTVGWEGKKALAVVSEVVNDYPGVTLYVVGNTDNVPFQSGARDNWTLSTERANAVTRILIKEGKVNATRIISGGRAGFHPIADNGTTEGKWQNRRTEIIINPNLERLLDMTGM
jgi:chemotaxis protein MotB